jgi:hypothetical protein
MKRENIAIVLFTYRKLECLERILFEIEQSEFNSIYVVIDAAESDPEAISVKKILSSKKLNKSLRLIIPPSHQGIINIFEYALKEVFAREEQAIILEDDTIPSAAFFEYCEVMLNKFRDDKSIGSIVGTNLGITETPNTYFKATVGLPYWGWATWANRWNLMQKNYDFWDSFILSDKYKQFVLAKSPFVNAFIRNRQTPKSWDLKWAMFQLSQNMRSIIPGINLISNNGYTELATFTRIENSVFSNIPISQINYKNTNFELENDLLIHEYELAQKNFISEFANRKSSK